MEVVFLPYKASMWDSMESVWRAAQADSFCDAYVVPIPYYDKNPDGSFGTFHYEGDYFPKEVEITGYEQYDLADRRPDVIVIHYPYDGANFVTSVHPDYYSRVLRQYTECLCYIPYYATTGAMSIAQAMLPAYLYADYIVIQSEKYRHFFDSRILDEKFLPLGSPKFDSVIRRCQEPPEVPKAWESFFYQETGERKRVYFYNTSIGGMLWDTKNFLWKMEYVFRTFAKHREVCLLWRPHPLLESSLGSMRPEYAEQFQELKNYFLEERLGILDTTPCIEDSIALSDVYIGDAGTSVTSLFGVALKPQFILNNMIHRLPTRKDLMAELLSGFFSLDGKDRWLVTLDNQLWHAPKGDYHYEFVTKLNDYTGGSYYHRTLEWKSKLYILPLCAQNLLVYEDGKIREIPFARKIEQGCAFSRILQAGHYLFLMPDYYPQMIRFNLDTEEIVPVNDIRELTTIDYEGYHCIGGSCIWQGKLVMGSPVMNRILVMDVETFQLEVKILPVKEDWGVFQIIPNQDTLWLLPTKGKEILLWDPGRNQVQSFCEFPEDFTSLSYPEKKECTFFPFQNVVKLEEDYVISPKWGNQYVRIDGNTSKIYPWELPMELTGDNTNYYTTDEALGSFVSLPEGENPRLYFGTERKLYRYVPIQKAWEEIEITFDLKVVQALESGYGPESDGLVYCAHENSRNSLEDLIQNTLTGKPFDREAELREYSKINASPEGNCGERVYAFLKQDYENRVGKKDKTGEE